MGSFAKDMQFATYSFCLALWILRVLQEEKRADYWQEIAQDVVNHQWLIWSNEHSAWWGPNGLGYTNNRSNAGRYKLSEAARIVYRANSVYAAPQETMVMVGGDEIE